MNATEADHVAKVCLDLYASLPPKGGKPGRRANGRHEWTVLSGIVLRVASHSPAGGDAGAPPIFHPISLATGTKSLPHTLLSPFGDGLHDSHAEVVARRGAVLWFMKEIAREVGLQTLNFGESKKKTERDSSGSPARPCVLQEVAGCTPRERRWALKDGVSLHYYVSALPCGDASTLHLSNLTSVCPAEDQGTSAVLSVPSAPLNPEANDEKGGDLVRGRVGYANFGALRTKPGRPDAPPTLSLSCTDKLSTYCAHGLQGALLSQLLSEPLYISSYTFGACEPESPDIQTVCNGRLGSESWEREVHKEIERALWRRLTSSNVDERLPRPCRVRRPDIYLTRLPFVHSREALRISEKRRLAEAGEEEYKGTNGLDDAAEPVSAASSIAWIDTLGLESLHTGIRLGAPIKHARPERPRMRSTRSRVCKLALFGAWCELRSGLGMAFPENLTYYEAKRLPDASWYWEAKKALRGENSTSSPAELLLRWTASSGSGHEGDEVGMVFGQTTSADADVTQNGGPVPTYDDDACTAPLAGDDADRPPFAAWVISDPKWESFDKNGNSQVSVPSALTVPR